MKRLFLLFFVLCAFVPMHSFCEESANQVITMDTPVNWRPDVIGASVEALYKSVFPAKGRLKQRDLELVERYADSSLSYTSTSAFSDFDIHAERLPWTLTEFLRKYVAESEGGKGVSLRRIADICLKDVGIYSVFCERLTREILERQAKLGLVAFDETSGNPKDIHDGWSDRIFSEDGVFYAIVLNYDSSVSAGFSDPYFTAFQMMVLRTDPDDPEHGIGDIMCKSEKADGGMATCDYTYFNGRASGKDYCQDLVFTLDTKTVREYQGQAVVMGGSQFMKKPVLRYYIASVRRCVSGEKIDDSL